MTGSGGSERTASWSGDGASAGSAAGTIRDQAAQAASGARGALDAMMHDARAHLGDVVDQQKSVGADQLAGFAKAAQNAAGELEGQNETVARLVRDAAVAVDRMAEDLRASDMRDLLQGVTRLARTYPVAVFAGSLLTGFALARLLKADAVPPSRRITREDAPAPPDVALAAAVPAAPVHQPPDVSREYPPL